MVGNGGVVGPNVKLPLPQSYQPSEDPPSVDPDPHIEVGHVVLLPDAPDQFDHVEAHLYAVLGVFLITDVLSILVIRIRCRQA